MLIIWLTVNSFWIWIKISAICMLWTRAWNKWKPSGAVGVPTVMLYSFGRRSYRTAAPFRQGNCRQSWWGTPGSVAALGIQVANHHRLCPRIALAPQSLLLEPPQGSLLLPSRFSCCDPGGALSADDCAGGVRSSPPSKAVGPCVAFRKKSIWAALPCLRQTGVCCSLLSTFVCLQLMGK